MSERIGVFGGTFDPIHVGHLVAAVNARSALQLDRVLMVVANEPWQKVGERAVTPATDRFALVEAAVGDSQGIEASAIEIGHGGASYTIDTVDAIHAEQPDAELFLIIGADVVAGLSTWERVERVKESVTLVVVNRPGSATVHLEDKELSEWKAVTIEVPALEISSTDLRQRAATGRPLDFLIPERAIRAIRARGLYALGR